MKRLLFTTFFLVTLGALAFATAASGPVTLLGDCKSTLTGNGSAKNNEPLAKIRAKDDWRDKAGAAYGFAYQHWIKSSGKNLSCSRSGGLGNRTWTCAAISQPCR